MRKFHSALLGAVLAANASLAAGQVRAERDEFGAVMRVGLPVAAAAISLMRDDLKGVQELGLSLAASAVATEGLKRSLRRPRPDGSLGSFPSGHTALAFAAAGYFHARYSLPQAVPLYALAAATAYSRVRTKNHYARDVLAGAAVGIGAAYLLTSPFEAGKASMTWRDGGVQVSYNLSW